MLQARTDCGEIFGAPTRWRGELSCLSYCSAQPCSPERVPSVGALVGDVGGFSHPKPRACTGLEKGV